MSNYQNHIGRYLVENDTGLFYKGSEFTFANPDALTFITGEIDLLQAANQVLYKTKSEANKYLILTKIDFVSMAVVAVANQTIGLPVINVGFTGSNYADIGESVPVEVVANFQYMASLINGLTPLIPPNTNLVLKKVSLAVNFSSYKIKCRILGFYIDL